MKGTIQSLCQRSLSLGLMVARRGISTAFHQTTSQWFSSLSTTALVMKRMNTRGNHLASNSKQNKRSSTYDKRRAGPSSCEEGAFSSYVVLLCYLQWCQERGESKKQRRHIHSHQGQNYSRSQRCNFLLRLSKNPMVRPSSCMTLVTWTLTIQLAMKWRKLNFSQNFLVMIPNWLTSLKFLLN